MHLIDFNSQTLQICKPNCFNKIKNIHIRELSRKKKQRPIRIINVIDWDDEKNCPINAIRRSNRTKKLFEKQKKLLEKQKKIIEYIINERQDGLTIKPFDAKGRGIVTTRSFKKDEFVIEYIGELIDIPEAKKREAKYAMDTSKGCYSYYFWFQDTSYCIDATEESPYLGRLINHSLNGNLVPKVVEVKGRPRLVFFAKDQIKANKEVTYDYGDRNKETLVHNPWLAQ